MQKTTLYLPTTLQQRLREESRREGRSQADLIREAVIAYLDARPRQQPGFIGLGDDGGLSSEDAKAWVRERWRAKPDR